MEAFTTKALALRFESLGHDCEFGLVQRKLGAEPLGLMRFTAHHFDCLRAGLQNGFDGLADDLVVYRNSIGHLVSLDNPLKFHFNTFKTDADVGELILQEKLRWKFLRSKLLGDLAAGDKIFVRRAAKNETHDDMLGLYADLKAHGPNTLLWVELPNDEHPSESVIIERDGLLRGFLEQRPMDTPTYEVNRDAWARLCRRALRVVENGNHLHFGDEFDITPAAPLLSVPAKNSHWSGILELGSNGRLRHARHGTLASYYQQENVLHVRWDAYDSQVYIARDGVFHEVV